MSKQKYPQTQSSTGKATVGRRLKTEGYSNAMLKAKRNARRQDAEARQQAHEGLTLRQRFNKALSRPGQSKRELVRIEEAMMASSQVFAG